MAKTRSMTRNQNHHHGKRFKTRDNHGTSLWSDLNHDMLFLVMMQLGIVDFLSFSGVCKLWRSYALSNKNMFMASKPPMSMFFSTDSNQNYCFYLEDFEGRKFKTLLPHSAGRTCVGLTCGYLVFYGKETRDFWLVNPITRHELHFPDVYFYDNVKLDIKIIKTILVFSPSIGGWVFLVLRRIPYEIWFCIAGKGAWNHVSSTSFILDIHAFKGRIYTLNKDGNICEMRLNPEPKLTTLEIKIISKLNIPWLFVSLGEKLYVFEWRPQDSSKVWELDFGKMKWVVQKKSIKEFEEFESLITSLKYYRAQLPLVWAWADLWSQYERYACFADTINKSKSKWYFPHRCLSVDLIDE